MGNYCCTEKEQRKASDRISVIRPKSLKDPQTKKEYQKTLQYILNQALQKFQSQYQIKCLKIKGLLGKGGQATVFQIDLVCQKKQETFVKKFAMKRVSKHKFDKQKTRQALLLQKQILVCRPSPFITQIQFACQDEAYIYFFMKLAQGGDSFSLIKNYQNSLFYDEQNHKPQYKSLQFNALGQEGVIFILASVILGIESLHQLNIIYRDLKPQNILLFSDGYPKLADFGVALKHQDQDQLFFQMKGTILYFAPQMLSHKGYDRSVDFWALGILAYEYIFKEPPFSAHIIQSNIFHLKIQQRLKKNKWPSKYISQNMKDFIDRLLIIDPKKRLGYNSIDQIKNHAIFESIDWQMYENRKLESPLTQIIKKYPVQINRQRQIDQSIDFEELGYLPFTFVRDSNSKQNIKYKEQPKFIIQRSMKIGPTIDDQQQTNNSNGVFKFKISQKDFK